MPTVGLLRKIHTPRHSDQSCLIWQFGVSVWLGWVTACNAVWNVLSPCISLVPLSTSLFLRLTTIPLSPRLQRSMDPNDKDELCT
eukprot:5823343-Amphidinium_carterae.1